MKAIVSSAAGLEVQQVKAPQSAAPGHLLIKMTASAINRGDIFFLTRPPIPGTVKSMYDIKGVSGAGKVLEIGEGVPQEYLGKNVTLYRQLSYSDEAIGAWSEYAHVPYLDCAILPDDVDAEDYSGAMVNIITPYAFLKQIINEGHKGIISTTGNSATGRAMIGICAAYDFPLISLVRSLQSKKDLEVLGAKNVLVQTDADFKQQLTDLAQQLNATAIFDGIGGQVLNEIIGSLPYKSTIYSFGYIGDSVPLTVNMSLIAMKNLTIKPFSNIMTETVQNPQLLAQALKEIGSMIHLPHFKTKAEQVFGFEQINEALALSSEHGGKAILKATL